MQLISVWYSLTKSKLYIFNDTKLKYNVKNFFESHIAGGWTVLHSAVNRGRKKIADLLLRNGANVDAANIYGETPLHWTTVNGNHLDQLSFHWVFQNQ